MKRFSMKYKISGRCHMIMHFRSTQLPQKRLHTGRNTQLRFVQHQYIALTAKQAFHIAASLSAQQAQPDARSSHCYRAAAPEQISQHRPSRIRSLTVGSIHSLLMVSESPRARFCVAERVFRALDRHTAQNGVDGKQGKIEIIRARKRVLPRPDARHAIIGVEQDRLHAISASRFQQLQIGKGMIQPPAGAGVRYRRVQPCARAIV